MTGADQARVVAVSKSGQHRFSKRPCDQITLLAGIGTLSTAFAISALAIGSCLLLLSAFWQHTRRGVLRWVPRGVRDRVPPT